MTQYLQKMFSSVNGPRDNIFKNILHSFDRKSISIFQVGAIEVLSGAFRYGSGWSDVFWATYIQKYGGSLIICDIDVHNLYNSRQVLDHIFIEKTFLHCDAYQHLSELTNWFPLQKALLDEALLDSKKVSCFDLVYLDGSNHPEETKKQFDMIDLSNTIVLVDDMEIKGTLIKDEYNWHIFDVTNKTKMGLLV